MQNSTIVIPKGNQIKKYIASYFAIFILDIALFAATYIFFEEDIIVATVVARMLSGFVNLIVNKNSVFGLKETTALLVVKYFINFFLVMGVTAVCTVGAFLLVENYLISKIIVDIALLLFNYYILKNWVFVRKMNKKQISKLWKACATLFFVVYIGFTLLNRFVIIQNVINLDDIQNDESNEQNITTDEENNEAELENNIETEDENALDESEPVYIEPIITDTSYIDENIQVEITTIREYDTDIYIAEIIISDSSSLMAGLAENSFGTNVKEKTSVIAEENDAIIAINGDYYGFRDYGYVMRNGYLYREVQAPGGNEDLVVYQDGSMQIIDESDVSAQQLMLEGAVQIFSFGPGLISDSEIMVSEESEVSGEDESNPRTAIAMIEPNHYIFMVADGRTDASEGLSLYEMAMVLSEYDCEVAYNLDGGGSATMVFMGEVVNFPTTNGRDYKERSVSDIVYIGE